MSIKIILTEAVEHLGDPGDIVRVTPGYARNFLFPKRVALEATEGNLRSLETKMAVWKEAQSRVIDRIEALKAKVQAVDLRFVRKSGPGGVLFGSVTNADVHAKLAEAGVEVERKQIQVKSPLKTVGDHEIGFRLHRLVNFKQTVIVEREAGSDPVEVPEKKPVEAAKEAVTADGEATENADPGAEAAEPAETAEDSKTEAEG